MDYRPQKKIFHQNDAAAQETEYQRRLTSPSTVTWVDFPVGNRPLFLMITPEVLTLTWRIQQNEGRIALLSSALPEQVLGGYFDELVTEEVLATNQTEGVRSTRAEVRGALAEVVRDRLSTGSRFAEFVRLYLDLQGPDRTPVRTLEEVRDIYDAVTRGELRDEDLPDGRLFRKGSVHIYDGAGRERHRGVMPESEVERMLTVMLEISGREDLPPLVLAVVGHLMFEYVHPFYDGNGRTGRYLLSRDLARALSPLTALRISRQVAREKTAYVRAFEETEHSLNQGDLTLFLLPMLRLIFDAQEELLADLGRQRDRVERLNRRLKEAKDRDALPDDESDILLGLGYSELFDWGGLSLDLMQTVLRKSRATVRKRTRMLEEEGLIRGTGKPLVFRLSPAGRQLLGLDDAEDPAI